jgi:glycosyltransferase involved in cell wall biosynthesis
MNHVHPENQKLRRRMSQKKYNIGILTPSIEDAGIIPLSNLMRILENISNDLHLITGGAGFDYFKNNNRINVYVNNHSSGTNTFSRVVNYIIFQINEARKILKISNKIDCWFFLFSAEFQIFPIMMARLCGKKVIIIVTGSSIKTLESKKDRLRYGLIILQFITCTFVEKIVVYSKNIIKDYSLERWTKKIIIARRNIIEFENFKITKEYLSRECIVGYIGRFSEEKGLLQLLNTIPDIVNKKPDVKFLFIGDGVLRHTIDQYILDNNLENKIILPGWISHELLPDYLNQMKLLVIPSDTEGLPNVMLEAMACGTPVLATPVGAIPDVIQDDENGFIMENNSSECIARNVMRVLQSPNQDKIVENGRFFVEENFSFDKIVTNWIEICHGI